MKIPAILSCLYFAVITTNTLASQIKNFERENLIAWCIVPFDSQKRTPQQRVDMLRELKLKKVAYDWRKEHVVEFEKEFDLYQKNNIELFAFWGTHPKAFDYFKQHNLKPQIWVMLPKVNKQLNSTDKIKLIVEGLKSISQQTKSMGCKLSLYNHGGWSGEPDTLIKVCQQLRDYGYDHVGIVYNWHHAHDHIHDWEEQLKKLIPYLHCLNLNGMNKGALPKILEIGQGQFEKDMIQTILKSSYTGPIGIIGHQKQKDVKKVLQDSLEGLSKILAD